MNSKINSAGRPTNKNVIKFSQQPRSTVSLFLLKERQKYCKQKILYDASYSKITLGNESLSQVKYTLNQSEKSSLKPYDLVFKDDYERPLEDSMPQINSFTCNKILQQSDMINQSEDLEINKEERKASQGNSTIRGMKIFSCFYPLCTYNTTNSSNMSKHKRTHSHNKHYLCDQCTFSTKFSNSLNVHKRLHTHEKPFTCSNCDYKCNSSSNLKKHFNHRH